MLQENYVTLVAHGKVNVVTRNQQREGREGEREGRERERNITDSLYSIYSSLTFQTILQSKNKKKVLVSFTFFAAVDTILQITHLLFLNRQ